MNHSPTTMLRLLGGARNGDTESLGQLLRNYFRYLNTLSVRNLDDRIRVRVSASDIVQETLLEAHRDFPRFIGTSLEEFTSWLRKILFNNLARAVESHLGTARRDVRKECSLDERRDDTSGPVARQMALPVEGHAAASAASRRVESLGRLEQAIRSLPPDYGQVIRLRHVEGLPFNAIAERLGRNPGATRMLWFRAVEKLKAVLFASGGEEP